MTREEKAIIYFKDMRKRCCEDYLNICPKHSIAYKATLAEKDFYDAAIEALESESRMSYVQETVNTILNTCGTDSIADKAMRNAAEFVQNAIDGSYPDFEELDQEPYGRCKDCKYFEYDSVAKVNGIPLIVAHEICSRWGDGCKTKEDGYCFLFEPKMQEVEE